MRHRNKNNNLSRTKAHREAMLSNMAVSLIKHKRIHTTVAKAKVLRTYVEPLLTRAKEDTTHSRRVVFSYLQDKEAVTILFREVAEKIADRPGGYTRILKTGFRLGDSADMCYIELVDYNENLLKSTEDKKATKGRSRRSSKKKTDKITNDLQTTQVAEKEDVVVEDETITEVIEQEQVEAIAETTTNDAIEPQTEQTTESDPTEEIKE